MDVNKYLDLIPSYNYKKPKFMAFVEAVLKHMISLSAMGDSIYTAFDIDNSAGDQMDVIGELVGVDRLLKYTPATGTRELSDEEYRLILKLKIARNEWNGTNEDTTEVYKMFQPESTIVQKDNQDMTVTVSFYDAVSSRQADIINSADAFLIPAGVSYEVLLIGGNTEFDLYAGACVSGIEHIDCVVATQGGMSR